MAMMCGGDDFGGLLEALLCRAVQVIPEVDQTGATITYLPVLGSDDR